MALDLKPHDVICKKGTTLILKSTNGIAACVKPSTMDKLLARGWGTSPLN